MCTCTSFIIQIRIAGTQITDLSRNFQLPTRKAFWLDKNFHHPTFANKQLLCWKFFSRTLRFWGTPCLSSSSVPWKQPSKIAQNGPKVFQSGPNLHFKCFRPCWTFLHTFGPLWNTFGKVGKRLFSEVEDTLEVTYVIGVFSLWKQLFPKCPKVSESVPEVS